MIDAYEPFRAAHPDGKFCPSCSQLLPVESYYLKTDRGTPRLATACIACERERKRQRREDIAKGRVTPRKQHKEIPLAVMLKRQPIPTLEVGKHFRVVVPNPDGRNPDVYEGDCVGRYGANWTLRTRWGWVTSFSPSQLAGAKVEVA